jgi:hypothetical protein
MVFLNLSVINIETAINFYVHTLKLFKLQRPNRLICSKGVELILDLREIGSEEHLNIFEQSLHVKSSFTISFDNTKLLLSDDLTANLFDFELTRNIAGSFLKMNDPSGNKLIIRHQDAGGIV